jgi:hypothetical protein
MLGKIYQQHGDNNLAAMYYTRALSDPKLKAKAERYLNNIKLSKEARL